MAGFTVVSPLAAHVRLANTFATGSSLIPTTSGPSSLAALAPPQRLQVTCLKKLMGKVVTDTNDKSVTVEVTRIAVYPKYKKRVKTTKNYIVHDPENAAKKGDTVQMAKCAPVSKRKQFVVVDIKPGKQSMDAVALSEADNRPSFKSAGVRA